MQTAIASIVNRLGFVGIAGMASLFLAAIVWGVLTPSVMESHTKYETLVRQTRLSQKPEPSSPSMDVGIQSLSAQFSLDHSDTETIKELYEIARSNAIRIEQSQTSTPLQMLPDLVETRLNVSAVGSYAALKNFVKLVTRSPRFFAVESIAVSSDGAKPNGTVNFRVQIIMWRQYKGNMQSNAAAKGV